MVPAMVYVVLIPRPVLVYWDERVSSGTGRAARFENVNAANTSATTEIVSNGTGRGLNVQLTNASNGSPGY